MPSKDFILFCDLETMGNQPTSDILEVGLVLTDRNLDVIASSNWLITPGYWRHMLKDIDPVVVKMHALSGLWDDLRRHPHNSYLSVEQDILDWLDASTDHETQHIPFAGSGVSHFDRQYVKNRFPKLDKRLTYWSLDVGVFRRCLQLFGVNEDFLKMYVEQKPHRALHDTMLAVAEMRSYMAVERRQSGLDPVIPWKHPLPGIDE